VKIAIVRKRYTFHGGAEGFSQSLISKLADTGNEVHIYAIKWDVTPQSSNIFFHKVPAIEFNSFLRDLTFSISSFYLLRKRRKYFDVIQSHDKTLYQDIYRAGDGCHIEWLKQRWKRAGIVGKFSIIFNPYHWLILFLERMIFKRHRYKKILAISDLVKRNIIDNYHLNENDIALIYNGVDLERFHPKNRNLYRGEIRNKYSIDKSEFVALSVGSGFERKGVEFLLKAVELIPMQITVLLVGKSSGNSFKDLAGKQRLIFCGPQKEIHKYYAASDVFVLPAIYEPFGNVHLEALASGLPVITTKNSGASEIIENGIQGFVIEKPENIEGIAGRIIELMNGDMNQRMSLEARKLAEMFSFDSHMKKMLEVYSKIQTGY
jgi:UDP-glucose:(heptosyl)LPS alpha-1,3-glucosyltransferase